MSKVIWDRMDEEEARRKAEREEYLRKRAEFRRALFGTDDPVALQKPQAIADFDALLRGHAAQLENAVSYAMEFALADDASGDHRAKTINCLTRMIQTNVAIAKVLLPSGENANAKTVRGGAAPRETQD